MIKITFSTCFKILEKYFYELVISILALQKHRNHNSNINIIFDTIKIEILEVLIIIVHFFVSFQACSNNG